MAQTRAPKFNRLQEIVMAKVIAFYIPKNFRNPLRTVAQPNSEESSSFAHRRSDRLSCYPLFAE